MSFFCWPRRKFRVFDKLEPYPLKLKRRTEFSVRLLFAGGSPSRRPEYFSTGSAPACKGLPRVPQVIRLFPRESGQLHASFLAGSGATFSSCFGQVTDAYLVESPFC